jgi:hypothetical protein
MEENPMKYVTRILFLVVLLGTLVVTACALPFNPVPTEVAKKETPLNEVGVVEPNSGGDGDEPTSPPKFLVYTNPTYGFEFEYPRSWMLTEHDQGVVLIKDRFRIGIRFQGVQEDIDRFSVRTGMPAGELTYMDKIRFMGLVIPAEVLVFEEKSKIVFYGDIGRIETDDLLFSITLDDRETYDYGDVDLPEEIIAEAKAIVESFKRIDKAEGSALRPSFTDTGLSAHLELPESLLAGEDVNLKFALTNLSDRPLYLLKWYTPLEGIGGEIFKITRDGQAVPYEGILAYRSFPTSEAYILLDPGDTISAVVDLGASFDFSQPGTYQIGFISPQISHIAASEDGMAKSEDDLGPVQILSNPIILEVRDD